MSGFGMFDIINMMYVTVQYHLHTLTPLQTE